MLWKDVKPELKVLYFLEVLVLQKPERELDAEPFDLGTQFLVKVKVRVESNLTHHFDVFHLIVGVHSENISVN